MNKNARVIAFYLPQYYPCEINNKWYGAGFTEWTNVGKAKPLFRNHYQPKVPADLGYYDLRYLEIKEQQIKLAKEAGIEGFCYYHYWFGGGVQQLDKPFKEVLGNKKLDLPFCLCWANQSWYAKFWSNDVDDNHKLIIKQTYDDIDGIDNHFYSLLDAFKDQRYIKVDGRLLFMIYRPLEYPDVQIFIKRWQELAAKNNIPSFYFIGQATNNIDAFKIIELQLDGVNIVRKDNFINKIQYGGVIKIINKLKRVFGFAPYHYNYLKISKYFIDKKGIEVSNNIFPTAIPNWDHSPRSGKSGMVFYNSTPENFYLHLIDVVDVVSKKELDKKVVFLKSWNEWGEGNYVEPCLKYGLGYIKALSKALNNE